MSRRAEGRFDGNLGREPEWKTVTVGQQKEEKQLLVLSLAWRPTNKHETVWIKCTCWTAHAQQQAAEFRVGQRVSVEGQIVQCSAQLRDDGRPVLYMDIDVRTAVGIS